MKTISAKASDIERKWNVVDAEGVVLGRLAAVVASRLRGKHKALYTSHVDCGDNIIVINAEKVRLTGRKMQDKRYYHHTGHPGGIKETSPEKIFAGKFPERVVQKAVERMLPRSPLGRQQMTKLHVYAGTEHPHAAQQPEVLDVAGMNPKNKRT